MDRVNIYTYVENRGPCRCGRCAGYILELIREGKEPVTLTDFTVLEDATNKQAELRVLEKALGRMKKSAALCIYERSSYVAAGYTCGWVKNWKKNGWQTGQGKQVANAEDWKKLDGLISRHTVRWNMTDRHVYSEWLEREVHKYAQSHKEAAVQREGA